MQGIEIHAGLVSQLVQDRSDDRSRLWRPAQGLADLGRVCRGGVALLQQALQLGLEVLQRFRILGGPPPPEQQVLQLDLVRRRLGASLWMSRWKARPREAPSECTPMTGDGMYSPPGPG